MMIAERRQSITLRKAVARLVLVNSAEIAMIGTTGSAPTIGTRTNGLSAPGPSPATPPMIEAKIAMPAMRKSSQRERSARAANTRSVRRRQPPHRELNAPVGQFAPDFDLGHVGGLGEAAEHLARLFARLLARQREGLAPERVVALAQRLGGACRKVRRCPAATHLPYPLAPVWRFRKSHPNSHRGPDAGFCNTTTLNQN